MRAWLICQGLPEHEVDGLRADTLGDLLWLWRHGIIGWLPAASGRWRIEALTHGVQSVVVKALGGKPKPYLDFAESEPGLMRLLRRGRRSTGASFADGAQLLLRHARAGDAHSADDPPG